MLPDARCARDKNQCKPQDQPKKHPVAQSEISPNGKGELFNEDLLESGDIVLLVEDEHGFFVIHGVNCTEGNRAIIVRNQDGIAGNACSPFVAVRDACM